MNFKRIALGTLGYFISSFVIQGFLAMIFAGDYFKSISVFRESPIIYFALPQTILSGIAFSILFPYTKLRGAFIIKGLKFGLLIGLMIVPFIALDLPARFLIPSVWTWVFIQSVLGIVHFVLTGILVAFIYKNEAKEN